jgi:DNA adenine methylase Dam
LSTSTTTSVAVAVSKKRLDKIESYRPEVKNSAAFDLEWIPYKGRYGQDKTKIFAASFCTNWGKRIVLHISKYSDRPDPEKGLIEDIVSYLDQFPLTFGWYSTGVVVYDDRTGLRVRGRDSDLFVLHQRCMFHNLSSPVEIKKTYTRLKDPNKKHIDLNRVFSKPIIQKDVFEGRYRTTDLDSVSRALLWLEKYDKLNVGTSDIFSLPIEQQMRYVRRDSELVMLLAQYNNCLVLRIMKVFAGYAKMDYYLTCHTEISTWYTNRYQKMLESGECTVSYTPNYKLDKQAIDGGHHTQPIKGFFIGAKIYELDIKGQYPSIAINNNFSFDTLNCTCCKDNENAWVKQEIIDAINEQLQANKIPRRVDRYWVCKKRIGAFPKVLQQTLSDRNKYLMLLKEEKEKSNRDLRSIEEYQTHQLGAKLFANAGTGLFGNEYFEFRNYRVFECITAEGRRIHKQMELMARDKPYNFKVVYGFTDSIFFSEATDTKVQDFIQACKNKLGVTVELKTVFTNSIFYPKKNRYVAWAGNEKDEPIIKGLDGLSDSNPLWVRRWFKKIVVELVKHPETRFEVIPKMIKEAFGEVDSGGINTAEELKFTQRLSKDPHEYKGHARIAELANLLDKDKGDLVYWYETYTQEYVKSKQCWKRKKGYYVKPENLNLDKYKNLLLNKLKDSLEIAGFDMGELKLQVSHATTISVGTQVNHMKLSIKAGFVPHTIKRENDNETVLIVQNFVDLRDVHPFVKWAGGKGQLLPELNKMIPSQFDTYFEPFLGGGAMFFDLVSSGMRFNAYLSDTTGKLITTYRAIKNNVKEVIRLLQIYETEYKKYSPYSKEQQEYYFQLRDAFRNFCKNTTTKSSNDVEIAALFIMLNKTGYNGGYRVNKKGEFNIPPGYWKNKKGEFINPLICDSGNLENVSNVLRNSRAIIFAGDYRAMLENAQKGDFVYMDPPYDPVSYTSSFTSYTPNGFGRENQEQLADVFSKLNSRGCLLLLSNSDTPFIRALYSGFNIKEVDVKRSINCKASKRMGHKELLISNYS